MTCCWVLTVWVWLLTSNTFAVDASLLFEDSKPKWFFVYCNGMVACNYSFSYPSEILMSWPLDTCSLREHVIVFSAIAGIWSCFLAALLSKRTSVDGCYYVWALYDLGLLVVWPFRDSLGVIPLKSATVSKLSPPALLSCLVSPLAALKSSLYESIWLDAIDSIWCLPLTTKTLPLSGTLSYGFWSAANFYSSKSKLRFIASIFYWT